MEDKLELLKKVGRKIVKEQQVKCYMTLRNGSQGLRIDVPMDPQLGGMSQLEFLIVEEAVAREQVEFNIPTRTFFCVVTLEDLVDRDEDQIYKHCKWIIELLECAKERYYLALKRLARYAASM